MYYDDYMAGQIVLPKAIFTHFSKIFPSADDFLIWLYFFEDKDAVPSQIAGKIGKDVQAINKSLENLQKFGAMKVVLLEIEGTTETFFDVGPAFRRLDDLMSGTPSNSSEQSSMDNDSQLKELIETFEAEMGMITPMQSEELRAMLFEDKYDINLIRLALKESVLNRKISFNYIKAILRNWKNEGITSIQAVENKSLERQSSVKSQPRESFHVPMDGPWNNK
ncbi:MAG: DnaD domain-containing protein [Streptococcaceae bacterium]|nr:DnaD domain-containing protein [Streptococcaceae bacterium]MCL2681023.1 DnaD domain-containing protein [Streptococcaceae bacterium]MCL2858360.1 DnaD domain-containing protein [Streptococcaceae bacterium]